MILWTLVRVQIGRVSWVLNYIQEWQIQHSSCTHKDLAWENYPQLRKDMSSNSHGSTACTVLELSQTFSSSRMSGEAVWCCRHDSEQTRGIRLLFQQGKAKKQVAREYSV